MGFTLARPDHDSRIRRLLRNIDMPGAVKLSYCREPDYFAGESVYGPLCQTLVYERDNAVMAMACRSIKPVFVNGRETAIGYLSGLRIDPAARNTGILGRGYKALRTLHADGCVPAYLSTIVAANTAAQTLLTSGRAGLPQYRGIGSYRVYTMPLGRGCKRRRSNRAEIIDGSKIGLSEIVRFLQDHGRQRQFFPVYRESDFNSSRMRGFMPGNFLAAIDGSKITGVLGIWDQGGFKQNIVTGYGGMMAAVRPLLNGAMRIAGFHGLPMPGRELKLLVASFICIANDEPSILAALIDAAAAQYSGNVYWGISLGLHERDPLRKALDSRFHLSYTSRIYLVSWMDGREFCDRCLGEGIPYLELATL
jgi:hypothetical protein